MTTFLDNHRGPFRLMLTRPYVTRKGFYRSEWIMGLTERDDVESEALGYLTDPRDTVIGVNVWSASEQQFIGGYKVPAKGHDNG